MTNAIESREDARTYSEWLKAMEAMRLGLRRGWISPRDLDQLRPWETYEEMLQRMRADNRKLVPLALDGPMPLDLRAYIVAKDFDPTKKGRTFPKIIAELVKCKDQLHPFARRYLLERLREGESKYTRLAQAYGVANQFDASLRPLAFHHRTTQQEPR